MKRTFGRLRNEHPSANALLLAIEGELPAKEELAVNQHLQKCWECRAQSEKIRDGILDYMAHHDREVKNLDPPPAAWTGFQYRLHNVEAECTAQLQPRRMSGVFAWSGALALVVLAVAAGFVSYLRLAHPPVVSASEILRLAVKAKRAELSRTQPIHTRLLVKHAGRSEEADLRRVFAASGWNWQDPLDPEAFERWRNSLAEKMDRVQTSPGRVTVITSSLGSTYLREASLTMRATDLHAVAEQLSLSDQTTIEISELPSEVGSSGTAVASGEAGGPAVNGVVAPSFPVHEEEGSINAGALAQTELQARVALHRVAADLGEQVDVRRDGSSILVIGLANTGERKRQIENSLAEIPNVKTAVQSISEMRVPRAAQSSANAVAIAAEPLPPVLQERLLHDFRDDGDRQRFIDRALAASQATLMRGWALRRLAERYTPEEIAHLDTGSRQMLQTLLNDHLNAMQRELTDVRTLWNDLLPAGEVPAEIGPSTPDWQSKALQLFPAIQSADQLSTWGLAGADRRSLDASTLLRNLAQHLSEAQIWLDRISTQLARPGWEQRNP